MKKSNLNFTFLQILYLIIFLILFSFIISTPTLIKGSLALTEKLIIKEEIIEGILIGFLFLTSVLIFYLYQREVNKHKTLIKKINNDKKKVEKNLIDSFSYIGQVNVQIEHIKTIFSSINKYPETKNDFKKIFRFLSERVLGIVNTNWVLFRIIDINTRRTISEHFASRGNVHINCPNISNKAIVEQKLISPLTAIVSNPKNLSVFVFCVIPIDKISNDQRVLIQAVTNQLAMLFVILNSVYYQNENNMLVKNISNDNIASKTIK